MNADDYYRVVYDRLAELRRGRDKRDHRPVVTKGPDAGPSTAPWQGQPTCRVDEPDCEACQ